MNQHRRWNRTHSFSELSARRVPPAARVPGHLPVTGGVRHRLQEGQGQGGVGRRGRIVPGPSVRGGPCVQACPNRRGARNIIPNRSSEITCHIQCAANRPGKRLVSGPGNGFESRTGPERPLHPPPVQHSFTCHGRSREITVQSRYTHVRERSHRPSAKQGPRSRSEPLPALLLAPPRTWPSELSRRLGRGPPSCRAASDVALRAVAPPRTWPYELSRRFGRGPPSCRAASDPEVRGAAHGLAVRGRPRISI